MSEVKTAANILAENAYLEDGVLKVGGGDHEVILEDLSNGIKTAILNNALFLDKATSDHNKMIFINNGSVYGTANDVVRTAIVKNLDIKGENAKEKELEEFVSLANSDEVHSITDQAVFPIAQKEKNTLIKAMS